MATSKKLNCKSWDGFLCSILPHLEFWLICNPLLTLIFFEVLQFANSNSNKQEQLWKILMGSLNISKHNKSSVFCCFILGMRTLFVYCKLCSLLVFSLSWNPTTSHGCSFRWVLPPLWFTRGENRYPFAFYLSFSLAENILTENINKKVSTKTINQRHD